MITSGIYVWPRPSDLTVAGFNDDDSRYRERCGFAGHSSFHRSFVQFAGMTPREYRQKNVEMRIRIGCCDKVYSLRTSLI